MLVACSILVSSAVLILWLGNFTNIDIVLADAAFDPASRTFPMRHAWIAETFNHAILKTLLSILGAFAVVCASWDALHPHRTRAHATRIGLRVVALSAVCVPLAISLLKRASTSHCPWDLQRYGGTAPYVRLLEWMPAGIAPGHCLPGGHASSALWLMSVAAFWWPHDRGRAIAIGIAMLAFGCLVGWGQQLRGAHFLTHTLWSAWLACALVLSIYRLVARLPLQSGRLASGSIPPQGKETSIAIAVPERLSGPEICTGTQRLTSI